MYVYMCMYCISIYLVYVYVYVYEDIHIYIHSTYMFMNMHVYDPEPEPEPEPSSNFPFRKLVKKSAQFLQSDGLAADSCFPICLKIWIRVLVSLCFGRKLISDLQKVDNTS